ncbi:MAG TPA: ABC transporter ATP-binding protein [Gemmataceae bacterium]|jgi:ATP-binding cassette subfamily B protein/subfamily B ATP-binding cassette protein MsbA
MRNFSRGLRATWPYRDRLIASIVCALLAAVLWSLNLTAIYPVLSLLTNDKGWAEQLDDDIKALQKDSAELRARLDIEHRQLEAIERWPEGSHRDDQQRQRAGTIAKLESRLLTASRGIYWRQVAKELVVRFLPANRFAALVAFFGILIVAVALRGVFEFLQESLVGSITNRTLCDLRTRSFCNVIHLDVGHFNDQGSHGLLANLTNDMETLGVGIRTLYGRVIGEPLKAVACVVVACLISWQLTLLFLVLVPVSAWVLAKVGRMMKRASRRLLERMSTIYQISGETFRGVRVMKAFTAEAHERRRFRAAAREYAARAVRVINLDAVTSPVIELLSVAAVSVALLAGAYLVLEKKTDLLGIKLCDTPMEIATLLQLYGLLAAIADPVRKLSSVYTKLQSGAAAADRIFAALDERPKVAANSRGPILGRHAEAIEFRDVCFSYEPGRPTLSNIRLEVRFGETVALVGKNGCGKTTLVGLLPRFYDPDYGSVLVDGVDLRKAHLRSLRRQIGLVTQDTVLFDDTVFANIAYGSRRATAEQVEAAARQAFAHDFVEKMPHGYQTRIGDAGAKLSGGQRQRLALARAMLRDPAVLILDEFTSQCDAESEALIHQALRRFVKNRTTFVISHRLHTLEIADRIVVLDRGRIEAVGTHAELLAGCDVYQRLHEAHFQRRVA